MSSVAAAAQRGLRILIVDDDDNLLFNLGSFLDKQGFNTVRAQEPGEALEAILERRADAAVIDYRLGRESGVELIQQIRELRPDFPVVLMSAYLDEWVECMVAGAAKTRCLRKPFIGSEVLDAIGHTLQEAP